jgi:signal transduction histidine kinase
MHIKKSCDKETEIKQTIKEANDQLQYISKTIDDFRDFYNPSKEKDYFDAQQACQKATKIASPTLTLSNIKITLQINENFTLYGNQNEFQQVIINIIHNARDMHIEQKTKLPYIKIIIDKKSIVIEDNAGGISSKNIKKIFEPYFSTKNNRDGIGLYISKTIIEKEMKGKLSVKNIKNGVKFTITTF